jgi:hypothetical protein
VYTLEMKNPPPWQSRVIQQSDDDCWLWQGRVEPGGHGQVTRGGKVYRVHRLAWEETYGLVPEGHTVAHVCGAPACCNPAHLTLSTTAELRKSEVTPWQERLVKQPDGCWIFQGSLNNDGYAQIRHDGRTVRLHRLAWEAVNGPIPKGMRVCHSCDTPACCNVAHLFLGTQRDNVRDMVIKGRFKGRASLNAVKTHCPQGHEYTPENTMTFNGMRSCRQCMNERSARYHRAKRKRDG